MIKPSFVAKSNIDHLIYYCSNHRLNTTNKKLLFKKKPCNGKIKYNPKTIKFYLIKIHNKISNETNIPKYDNNAYIDIEIRNITDFKKSCLDYLNKHPLCSFNYFKKKVTKLIEK